jgi:tetratricopeptide (TPR) repeat protein
MLLALPLALAALAAAPAPAASDDLAPIAAKAVRLYNQGRYDEALVDLEGLDAAGAADGALLYRLFFCERATGHEEAAQKALERARQALEKELATATSIEVPFYLANTYSNLGKLGDAQGVAREAIAKLEAGTYTPPGTAIGAFQLGKLYQDAGKSGDAVRAYRKAVDGFDLKDGRYEGNARWALRYIGSAAYAQGDFAGSDAAFARLTGLGGALPSDWSALAAARVRLGQYASAAEAWKAAVKLDPAGADDARYSARLAETAATVAPLPLKAPDGKTFAAMVQTELEAVLKEQAATARSLQARAAEAMRGATKDAPPHDLEPKLRVELQDKLNAARSVFLAAALEYSVRRFPLRETAFREGYAVLVFQNGEWELPPDPSREPVDEGENPS